MSTKQAISTKQAPIPAGTYSQAIKAGNTVYLAGQIPLDPVSNEMVEGFENQVNQIFKNLAAVAEAAGGSLANMVKLNVFLTDLNDFPMVNATMAKYISEPYPARSTIGVAALPKGAAVEIEGIMVL
jgi:reactive intermediate/imine deaminase